MILELVWVITLCMNGLHDNNEKISIFKNDEIT